MKSSILLASTALALVLQPVTLPLSDHSWSGQAYAQTATESDEELKRKQAEEAAQAAEQPANDNATKKAQKEAEKAARQAEKEAEKAAEAEANAAKQAEKEAAKAAENEAKAARQAEKEAERAAKAEAKAAKKAEEESGKAAQTQPAQTEPAEQTTQETEKSEPAAEENTTVETAEPSNKQKRKKQREAEASGNAEPDTAGGKSDTQPEAGKEVTTETNVEPGSQTTAQTGGEAPPAPSADAPVANEVASEPIETQIQQAEETAPAVVPDEITAEQRKDLKAADNKRRKKAKDNRAELIGAAAVGVAIGALLPSIGGTVVEDQGDRFVVEREGRYYVRKDESALFRDNARDVEYERLRGGRVLETVYRRNGSRIETIRDAGGYVLRRVKITPNGREIILFDSRDIDDRRRINYTRTLPPIQLSIPREEYIVLGGNVGRRSLAEVFSAGPVEEITNEYSLRDIRENVRVRDIVRRVDLDTINFDSGSFTVRSSQVPYLADTAGAMLDEIDANPDAVFLIEGHTDAVGSDVSNLTLSDRRAETVARILVEAYDVPAENLVTEGYGEQFLKVETEADERENRRVTIRNIAPLLNSKS